MTTDPNTSTIDVTQTWTVASGDWSDGSNWSLDGSAGVVPLAGDTLDIATGTAQMHAGEAPGVGEYDDVSINLGTVDQTGTLDLLASRVGALTSIDVGTSAAGSIVAIGDSEFDGLVDDQGTLTLASTSGALTFGSAVTVTSEGAVIDVDGTVALNGTINGLANTGDPQGTIVNDGMFLLNGGTLRANVLTGTGTLDLGFDGSAEATIESGQVVRFDGLNSSLTVDNATATSSTITGFQAGDTIVFGDLIYNQVSYDPSAHTLTLIYQNLETSVVQNFTAAAGSLTVEAGGVVYADAPSSTLVDLQASEDAVGANTVQATMTHDGSAITGAGVTIGIISDSFNADGAASQAAADGYIPNNVDVLSDYSGGTNEGLAMAELVHQIAPGASIMFASGEPDGSLNENTFSAAVASLHAAGANIIVDDLDMSNLPLFQESGPAAIAVGSAVAAGIDYFTSAGNDSNNYLASAFDPQTVELANGSSYTAEIFDNGTPYEPISGDSDGSTWYLQWDQPYYGVNNGGASADELNMLLFNAQGSVVAESETNTTNFTNSSGSVLQVAQVQITPPDDGTYYLAIYQQGDVAPGNFELYNTDNGYENGTLLDPDAGTGATTLNGDKLLPGVNAVGSDFFGQTPAYATTGDYPEDFSVGGTASLLFNANGTALASPETAGSVDFVAPDGVNVPVSGFSSESGDPFFGTSASAPVAAAVAALMLQADPDLTTTEVTDELEQSALPLTDVGSYLQGAGLIQAPGAVQLALNAECYARGTRLATERGEIPIETLRVGDRLLLAEGGVAPAIWIGRRVVDRRFGPRPCRVRIRAGAFGPGQPRRDLVVSPDHALFLDGVLIPARCLADGARVIQDEVALIEWWHVELPSHAAILAEGLPAESYLDVGNRAAFAFGMGLGVGVGVGLGRRQVADVARLWEAEACAPLVSTGARLAEARSRVIAPPPL